MLPNELIRKYYASAPQAHEALVRHGMLVARKALEVARGVPHLEPNLQFIGEAALLHDIGIIFTDAPEIGCFGTAPYIRHGVLGRELLEKEGLAGHALVCERHVGAGIIEAEIRSLGLPLPLRDMRPLTVEEKIICYADKFFSKKPGKFDREMPLEEVRREMKRYGEETLARFDELRRLFSS